MTSLPANSKVLVSSCSWPNEGSASASSSSIFSYTFFFSVVQLSLFILIPSGYNHITVPATSELIFADAPMTLKVRNILVEVLYPFFSLPPSPIYLSHCLRESLEWVPTLAKSSRTLLSTSLYGLTHRPSFPTSHLRQGGVGDQDEIGPNSGTKGIGVATGAVIDMHGKTFTPTWTRLGATAVSGDSVVYLQREVNWEVAAYILKSHSHCLWLGKRCSL